MDGDNPFDKEDNISIPYAYYKNTFIRDDEDDISNFDDNYDLLSIPSVPLEFDVDSERTIGYSKPSYLADPFSAPTSDLIENGILGDTPQLVTTSFSDIPQPSSEDVYHVYVNDNINKVVIHRGEKSYTFELKDAPTRKEERIPYSQLERKCVDELYYRYKNMGGMNKNAIAKLIYHDIYFDEKTNRPEYLQVRRELKVKGKVRTIGSLMTHIYSLSRKKSNNAM